MLCVVVTAVWSSLAWADATDSVDHSTTEVSAPSGAGKAKEPNSSDRAKDYGEKTFDIMVLRPLQSLAVVGGAALFVPAAAMASPGGSPSIEEAWDYLVVVRYEDAWKRRLGSW